MFNIQQHKQTIINLQNTITSHQFQDTPKSYKKSLYQQSIQIQDQLLEQLHTTKSIKTKNQLIPLLQTIGSLRMIIKLTINHIN